MATKLFYSYIHQDGSTQNEYGVKDPAGNSYLPESIAISYWNSLIFDVNHRTIWHQGMPFGNVYPGTLAYGEVFNDLVNNIAEGRFSHVEGYKNTATSNADQSHVEGESGYADAKNSHIEGSHNVSYSTISHLEGSYNVVYATHAHVEGNKNTVKGSFSHGEGSLTYIESSYSHAEGYKTTATGAQSHVEGNQSKSQGDSSHAEGDNTKATGNKSHAEGNLSESKGNISHAEGYNTKANGEASHAEGNQSKADGNFSHTEGTKTYAKEESSHAEGQETNASAKASHAEGLNTSTNSIASHVEGNYNVIQNNCLGAHAEGTYTTVQGEAGHTEGRATKASGIASHAEGLFSYANGEDSHVEGAYNKAEGNAIYSHVGGFNSYTTGRASFAHGDSVYANAELSFATGTNTIADGINSTTFGKNTHTYFNGTASIAIGTYTYTDGENAISTGFYSYAKGTNSVAFGAYSYIFGDNGIVGGAYSYNYALNSIAFGEQSSTANGISNTIAVGNHVMTKTSSEASFGQYNICYANNSMVSSTIFSVGIGSNEENRRNAFDARLDGTTYFYNTAYGVDHGEIGGHPRNPNLFNLKLSPFVTISYLSRNAVGKWEYTPDDNRNYPKFGEYFNDYEGNHAYGNYSHVEGGANISNSSATYSHVEGVGNIAYNIGEHVSGRYALSYNTGETLFVVGDGISKQKPHNAFKINQKLYQQNAIAYVDDKPIVTSIQYNSDPGSTYLWKGSYTDYEKWIKESKVDQNTIYFIKDGDGATRDDIVTKQILDEMKDAIIQQVESMLSNCIFSARAFTDSNGKQYMPGCDQTTYLWTGSIKDFEDYVYDKSTGNYKVSNDVLNKTAFLIKNQ